MQEWFLPLLFNLKVRVIGSLWKWNAVLNALCEVGESKLVNLRVHCSPQFSCTSAPNPSIEVAIIADYHNFLHFLSATTRDHFSGSWTVFVLEINRSHSVWNPEGLFYKDLADRKTSKISIISETHMSWRLIWRLFSLAGFLGIPNVRLNPARFMTVR